MLIVAADLHVRPETSGERAFLEFLEWISETTCDVCFLGDVMELWIGVPRFGDALQRRFVEWCRREKGRRHLYFLEGNHEFFVVDYEADGFTAVAEDTLPLDGGALLFCHGDICQASNGTHLFLRRLMKSWLAKALLKWLPGVRRIVKRIQATFRRHSRKRKHGGYLPQAELEEWVSAQRKTLPALRNVFLGHFHRRLEVACEGGVRLTVLPAWRENGEIAFYEASMKRPVILPWRSAKAREMARK